MTLVFHVVSSIWLVLFFKVRVVSITMEDLSGLKGCRGFPDRFYLYMIPHNGMIATKFEQHI